MRIELFIERNPARLVDHYVETRKDAHMPLSTLRATRAIRAMLPECGLSDDQLQGLIVEAASRRGHTVATDEAAR